MTSLTIRLLGPPQVESDGVALTFATRKAVALLAYLAVTGARPTRDALATMFWPEANQAAARNALRYTLGVLKKTIGREWLVSDRESIALAPQAALWLDVTAFRQQIASSQAHDPPETGAGPVCVDALTQAVACYGSAFMVGFTLPDSPAFDEWQFYQRERFQEALLTALDRLALFYTTQADWPKAIDYARRRLALDPLHEPAHQRLMQLYTWAGRRTAALRQYRECARLLAAEIDTAPTAETEQLLQAIQAHRLAPPPVQNPAPAPPATPPSAERTPAAEGRVVAREIALATLHTHLATARSGQGQLCFMIGEAGSGKSALLHAFAQQACQADNTLLVLSSKGNAHTGLGDPYLLFRDLLSPLVGVSGVEAAADRFTREQAKRWRALLPVTLPLLVNEGADLIGRFVPTVALTTAAQLVAAGATAADPWQTQLARLLTYRADPYSANADQEQIMAQVTTVLTTLAVHCPLLLILDDLQWADAASIALLFHLSRHLTQARILLLGAYRPTDVALGRWVAGQTQRHPLAGVINELRRTTADLFIDLDRANAVDGRRLVDALVDGEPNRLDEAFRTALHRQTDGNPLFILELLHTLQAGGTLTQDGAGRWVATAPLNWPMLPARIEAVLAERIDRLDEPLQELLTIASIEGEQFTAEVLSTVQGTGHHSLLWRLNNELDRRHQLIRPAGVDDVAGQRLTHYRFTHHLFQQYLAQRLNPGEQAALHEEVGLALETLHGPQREAIAVPLAKHFQVAGRPAKAVHYLLVAGQRALQVAALPEALAHLTQGRTLLATLPTNVDRNALELPLQMALGVAYTAAEGYASPASGQAFQRAAELAQQAAATPHLLPILRGLIAHYLVYGDLTATRRYNQQLLRLAERLADPAARALADLSFGTLCFYTAEYAQGRHYLAEALTYLRNRPDQVHAASYAHDPTVACLTHLAHILWALGYPDQALAHSQEAVALAQSLDHAPTLAQALLHAAFVRGFRREWRLSQTYTEATIDLATKARLSFWLAEAQTEQATALIEQGAIAEGLALAQAGSRAEQATGARFGLTYSLADIAKAEAKMGNLAAAMRCVDEGLALVESSGERWYEIPLYMLKSELLLQGTPPEPAAAEAILRHAIALTQAQQAKSWELRVTLSLCRLLQRQGDRGGALALLAPLYQWFKEGFDTPDLQEATALLKALAGIGPS